MVSLPLCGLSNVVLISENLDLPVYLIVRVGLQGNKGQFQSGCFIGGLFSMNKEVNLKTVQLPIYFEKI